MRKVLFLVAVAVLLGGADVAARAAAEGRLANRAARVAGTGASASADIGSLPFAPRLLLSGSVPRVRVRAEPVSAGPLIFRAVEVDLRGVTLDRSAMYGGQVRLQDIDRGTVTVELDATVLTRALGAPVTLGDGLLEVVRGAQASAAQLEVTGGTLVVTAAGVPTLRLDIPRTDLSPCDATSVRVSGDRLLLECTIADPPLVLLP